MHPELWWTTLGLWFTSTLLNLLNLSELWSCSVERSIVTLHRSGGQVSSRPVNTPWAVNKSRVHHFMRVPPHANTWRLKHLALSLSWPTLADIKTCERWMKHCSGRNERQTQCIGRCTGLTRNVTQILPEETFNFAGAQSSPQTLPSKLGHMCHVQINSISHPCFRPSLYVGQSVSWKVGGSSPHRDQRTLICEINKGIFKLFLI